MLVAKLGELGGLCRQGSLYCYKPRPGLESLQLSNRIKQYAGRVDAAMGEVGVSVPPEPSLMPTLDLAALLRGGPKCSVTCNGKSAWFGGKVSVAASVPVGGVLEIRMHVLQRAAKCVSVNGHGAVVLVRLKVCVHACAEVVYACLCKREGCVYGSLCCLCKPQSMLWLLIWRMGGAAAVPGPPGGRLRHPYAQGRARVLRRLQGLLERHFWRSLRGCADIPSLHCAVACSVLARRSEAIYK